MNKKKAQAPLIANNSYSPNHTRKGTYAMTIISQTDRDFQRATDTVSIFLRTFHVASLLRAVGAAKQKGVAVMDIFRFILSNVFTGRSMYRQMLSKAFDDGFSKNACYRFLIDARINWTRFTVTLSALIAEKVRPLTEENRADAFIVDDTLYERTSVKRTELAARVFDHNEHRYKKGFRLLTLGWSDGTSFLPIASRLMSSKDDKKVLGTLPELDMRTTAGKIRAQARRKMTGVMVELLRDAIKAGHKAKYVLFDRWFSSPAQIKAIKALEKDKALCDGNGAKLDVIAAIKKGSKTQYLFEGKPMTVRQIFRQQKKRRGRSRYLLSVDVEIPGEERIPARVVCVRNRANRKEWIAILCTDMEKSPEDIIAIYGKRWDIEVFFKACKSFLWLGKECHSLSYDALTAHVAFVFTRYLMLALAKRESEDARSLGGLFYLVVDEMRDKTFNESVLLILDSLLASVEDALHPSERQMGELLTSFFTKLPDHIQRCLAGHVASCV